jgi:AcrR family transcriptional regulator
MSSQQRGEATRQRILEAAQESFASQGYDATSVAEICRQAGVTKGGFYHHFPSKQALFLELLEGWLSSLDTLLEAIRETSGRVPEAIIQMAGMVEQIFHTAGGQLPMFLEFWNRAARDPEVWQATVAPYRRYRAYFASLMKDGIAEGSLRPVDPELAAHMIVSVAVGLVLQGLLDPQGADWGQVARDSIRVLLEDMERR